MQETTLSSGKKVKVRNGSAEDFIKAQGLVKKPDDWQLALTAVLVEIDGKKMTLEEVRKMPIEDYIEIAFLLDPILKKIYSKFEGNSV